jgi:hypothetical protein
LEASRRSTTKRVPVLIAAQLANLSARRVMVVRLQVRPAIPATAALDQLADWWATSHGTTGAPPPTPDLNA